MKYSHFATILIVIAILWIVAMWLTAPTPLMPNSTGEIKSTPLPYTQPLQGKEGKG